MQNMNNYFKWTLSNEERIMNIHKFNCSLRVLIFFSVILLVSSLLGSTYYIDSNNGSDTNDGLSPETAWKTIKKINSTSFVPGDKILFQKGDIWREQLTVSSSGDNGNPIIFGSYGSGDLPIIHGGEMIENWTQYNSNIYQAECDWKTYVVAEDAEYPKILTPIAWDTNITNTAPQMGPGTWTLDTSNDRIYIWCSDNESPRNHTIEVSKRNYGIDINSKQYVEVKDLKIKYTNKVGTGSRGSEPAAYNIFENLTIIGCRHSGIFIQAAGATTNEYNVIRNNIIRNCGNGAYAWDDAHNTRFIKNRIVHSIRYEGGSPVQGAYTTDGIGIGCYESENVEISGNTILNCEDPGIEIDNSAGTTVKRNFLKNNGTAGISPYGINIGGYEKAGTISIQYNVLVDHFGRFGYAISSGHPTKSAPDEVHNIHNNTIYTSNSGGGISCFSGKYNINNNIICLTNEDALAINFHSIVDESESDYNIFYNGGGNLLKNDGNSYSSVVNWTTATSNDNHSKENDPQFIDAANNDFTPDSGSVAIDMGIDLGFSEDFYGNITPVGNAPDIGAIERQEISIIYGDIDSNGIVQGYDAAIVLQYSLGMDPIPALDDRPWSINRVQSADVDQNGTIQSYDAALILQYSLNIIDTF